MINIDLLKLKDIEYQLLVRFAEICEENSLRYSLAGGTLLGAIRHQDFIPWDDDIDVIMPRPDYEQFLKIAGSILPDYIKILSSTSNTLCKYTYAKLFDDRTDLIECGLKSNKIGAYIDIFPVDGLPAGSIAQKKHFKKLSFYKNLLTLRLMKIHKGRNWFTTLLMLIILPPLRWLPYKKLIRKIQEIAQQYDFAQSNEVAFQVLGYGMKEIVPSTAYENMPKKQFRDRDFYVVSNYDTYLKQLFGNYMQLPPENKRKSNHIFDCYWKDEFKTEVEE